MSLSNGLHAVPAGKMPVVVTYLEMHKPPALADLPRPDGITFRRVMPTVEWYRDVFSRVGQDWLWSSIRRPYQTALAEGLANPSIEYYTLAKDGQDEALLELDFRKEGECELAYFGLTKALIGSGAGRYLMTQAIRRAWAADITRFHVHTCTNDSPQALTFYIRSGFTPFKREIDIDDDPRLSGFLPADAAPAFPII